MGNRVWMFMVVFAGLPSLALPYKDITNDQLKAMLTDGEKVLVIDVRETSETPNPIAGSLQLPWNSKVLQTRYREIPTDIRLAVICQSSGRSPAAAAFLEGVPDRKFLEVLNVRPGMGSWGNWTRPGTTLNRLGQAHPVPADGHAGLAVFSLRGRSLAMRSSEEIPLGNRQDTRCAPSRVSAALFSKPAEGGRYAAVVLIPVR